MNSLGSRVSAEVKRIMQPSLPSTSHTVTVDRRSKFRSSSSKRPPLTNQTFSKKVIVFKCMAPKSPKCFARKETDIVTRGFISDVFLDSTEGEMRQEIYEVILNAGLRSIGPKDFEFVDVNGKTGCVLSRKEGSEFSGRAIKQVAGTGAIYVRLLKHPTMEISDSSEEDDQSLPPLPFSFHNRTSHNRSREEGFTDHYESSTGIVGRSMSTAAISNKNANQSSLNHSNINKYFEASVTEPPTEPSTSCMAQPSTSHVHLNEAFVSDIIEPSASIESSVSYTPNTPTLDVIKSPACDLTAPHASCSTEMSILCENDLSTPSLKQSNPQLCDIEQLQQPFPNFPPHFIADLYTISKCNFTATLECLLEGNLSSVLSLINGGVLGNSPDLLSLSITSLDSDSKEELIATAFQFYKRHHYNPLYDLSISLKAQPAIDAGGVRRAFFTQVFQQVAEGYLGIFEGPPNRLRPAYKMSTINSGILKTLGQMIGHSLLLDKVGFPYLSAPCYYYMAGKWDTAVTYITDEDVSCRVHNVLIKVCML